MTPPRRRRRSRRRRRRGCAGGRRAAGAGAGRGAATWGVSLTPWGCGDGGHGGGARGGGGGDGGEEGEGERDGGGGGRSGAFARLRRRGRPGRCPSTLRRRRAPYSRAKTEPCWTNDFTGAFLSFLTSKFREKKGCVSPSFPNHSLSIHTLKFCMNAEQTSAGGASFALVSRHTKHNSKK